MIPTELNVTSESGLDRVPECQSGAEGANVKTGNQTNPHTKITRMTLTRVTLCAHTAG
jgi:hypothetical protein